MVLSNTLLLISVLKTTRQQTANGSSNIQAVNNNILHVIGTWLNISGVRNISRYKYL